MAFDCRYYWLIEPLRSALRDDGLREPASRIAIAGAGQLSELAIYCDEASDPEFGRLLISDLKSREIPSDLVPFIQDFREQLISTLRLMFDPHVRVFEHAVWTFSAAGELPPVGVDLHVRDKRSFDPDRFREIFIACGPIRESVRLYLDGTNATLPVEFRFLSLFKILEKHFRAGAAWRYDDLDGFLEQFAPSPRALAPGQKQRSWIFRLRDRCAHAVASKGRGATAFNVQEINRVKEAIPVMSRIGAALISDASSGEVVIVPGGDNTVRPD